MTPMPFVRRSEFVWRLRTRSLALGRHTRVMAILNLTPDSFSGDGLAGAGLDVTVETALSLLDGGADILDVGAESTRPGAVPLSAEEEQARLLPVLEAVCRERPEAILSVDTYHAATARAAAAVGAEIVNDVSGLQWDAEMTRAVADLGCGLVLMHTRGRPPAWREMPALGGKAVVEHVVHGLEEGRSAAQAAGIEPERVVLDPGISFGKKGPENFALLAQLGRVQALGRPLLVGLSRKGFLGEAVAPVQPEATRRQLPAVARLQATIAGNVTAILAGAHLVRVHDLQPAREAAAIADAVLAAIE